MAVIANAHGVKATSEDFMPKRETGMGPEVYHRFVEEIERGS
jgi:hypothetical protein